MNKMEIIDVWDDSSIVYIKHWVNGERQIQKIKYKWYFFVENSEEVLCLLDELLQGRNYDCKIDSYKEFDDSYIQVFGFVGYRKRLYKVFSNNGVRTFELDFSLSKRWMNDNIEKFDISNKYEVLFFDIETDDRTDEIIVGREQILSFAGVDNNGKEFFFCEENEEKLLKQIIGLFNKYDIIVGWNSRSFDLPYIKARLERFDIVYNFKTIIHLDFMHRFKKLFKYDPKVSSFSLNFISNYFLGIGKIDRGEKIYDLFTNNRKKLEEYNLQDARLLKLLDDKQNVLDLIYSMSNWCKTCLSRFFISELLDNYILWQAHKRNIRLLSDNLNFVKTNSSYKGGFVIEPTVGLYKNIAILDFKSLYPNIIRSWNISIENMSRKDNGNKIKSPNGIYFSREKGIIPSVEDYFLNQRVAYKKEKVRLIEEGRSGTLEFDKAVSNEIIVKELSNSCYGIMGKQDKRFFNVNVAESITLAGQYLLKKTQSFAESKGFKVVGGDTDSIMIGLPLEKCGRFVKDINLFLAKEMKRDFNIDESYIEIEFEKYFESFLVVMKKNYGGTLTQLDGKPVNELYVKGLDLIKKDTILFAKDSQKELLQLILERGHDEGYELFHSWILGKKREWMNKKCIIDDVVIRKRLSKRPDQYASKVPYLDIARELQKNSTDFFVGMEIPYVVYNGDKNLEVIHADDFDGTNFDRAYYWNKQILPKLKRLMVPLFGEGKYIDLVMTKHECDPCQQRLF